MAISQVVLNLLNHAMDATPRRTILTRIAHDVAWPGRRTVLDRSSTAGAGCPADLGDRIFERS